MVGPRHPREALAERNAEAILEAAADLITRHEEPTVSAIANAAGVSRPTVYAHFPDRHQLLEAVVARTVRRAMAAIESADPGRGRAGTALIRVVEASWSELAKHQGIAAVAAAELGGHALRRAHASAHTVLVELVERGQRDGSIRTQLPAGWLVAAVLALMHAAAQEVRTGALDPPEAADVLVRSVAALAAVPRR